MQGFMIQNSTNFNFGSNSRVQEPFTKNDLELNDRFTPDQGRIPNKTIKRCIKFSQAKIKPQSYYSGQEITNY